MSGSKTRFGYTGGSDPPDSDEPQSARTVYGHDIHLRLPSGFPVPEPPPAPAPTPVPVPPPPGQWSPAARVRAPMSEQESTNRIPTPHPPRPRQSRLARFLGRWTRSGRFESNHDWQDEDEGEVDVPRDPTGRNVLLVVLVAGLTFLITFAVVKLRQRLTFSPTPATETASPAGSAPPRATLPPQPGAAVAAGVGTAPNPAIAPPPAIPSPAAAPPPATARGLGPLPATPSRRKSSPGEGNRAAPLPLAKPPSPPHEP
jgi:hypothetical protein